MSRGQQACQGRLPLRGSRHDLPTVCSDDGWPWRLDQGGLPLLQQAYPRFGCAGRGTEAQAQQGHLVRPASGNDRSGHHPSTRRTSPTSAPPRHSSPLTRWVWHGKKPVRSPSPAASASQNTPASSTYAFSSTPSAFMVSHYAQEYRFLAAYRQIRPSG